MATTAASNIYAVKLSISKGTCQRVFVAHGVIDVLPSQLFHIFTYNFVAKMMHLLKHMAVAFAAGPSPFVMTTSSTLHNQLLLRTRDSLDHSRLREKCSAYCEAEHIITLSKALQSKQDNVHSLFGAINYKARTDRNSQIDEQVRRKQKSIVRLKMNRSKAIAKFGQYHATKKPFIDILLQFQSMKNTQLGRIIVAK